MRKSGNKSRFIEPEEDTDGEHTCLFVVVDGDRVKYARKTGKFGIFVSASGPVVSFNPRLVKNRNKLKQSVLAYINPKAARFVPKFITAFSEEAVAVEEAKVLKRTLGKRKVTVAVIGTQELRGKVQYHHMRSLMTKCGIGNPHLVLDDQYVINRCVPRKAVRRVIHV
ncbi:hypothetical protein QQS21_009055 [Conoideocrella luteorostrata]|uniref:Uncharacterized protein n=1 Tax=Conoideocrella luteorostrata TaxID=1105319 RepID=A0AAJ0CM39_9HYPO|nr:hypothetical protein QQS21_009055 [Conoideocrella luteorostrata]